MGADYTNTLRMLLVEDEDIERNGLLRQVDWQALGIDEVSDVSDGIEAMKMLSENEYHILLTDIKMPCMNGTELANKSRVLYPNIQVIFASGYDDFSYLKSAVSIGACEYILKPVNTEELTTAVIKAVDEVRKSREPELDVDELDKIAKGLSDCILALDCERTGYLIDYFFDDFVRSAFLGKQHVKSCCIHIISRLQITLLYIGYDVNTIFGDENTVWVKLLRFETILDLRMWMKNLYAAVIEELSGSANENKTVTSKVLEYIESEYGNDISLKKIAGELFYSSNHLGMIFRQITGKGFMEYLIEYRMKKASEILSKEDLYIYEVANLVGYSSVPSFTKHFKDYFHATPATYKRRHINYDAPQQ